MGIVMGFNVGPRGRGFLCQPSLPGVEEPLAKNPNVLGWGCAEFEKPYLDQAPGLQQLQGTVGLLGADAAFVPPFGSAFREPQLALLLDPQAHFALSVWQMPVNDLAEDQSGDQVIGHVDINPLHFERVP